MNNDLVKKQQQSIKFYQKQVEDLHKRIEQKDKQILLLEACLKGDVLTRYEKIDLKIFSKMEKIVVQLASDLMLKLGRPVSSHEIEKYYVAKRHELNLPPIKPDTIARRVRALAQQGHLYRVDEKRGLYMLPKKENGD